MVGIFPEYRSCRHAESNASLVALAERTGSGSAAKLSGLGINQIANRKPAIHLSPP